MINVDQFDHNNVEIKDEVDLSDYEDFKVEFAEQDLCYRKYLQDNDDRPQVPECHDCKDQLFGEKKSPQETGEKSTSSASEGGKKKCKSARRASPRVRCETFSCICCDNRVLAKKKKKQQQKQKKVSPVKRLASLARKYFRCPDCRQIFWNLGRFLKHRQIHLRLLRRKLLTPVNDFDAILLRQHGIDKFVEINVGPECKALADSFLTVENVKRNQRYKRKYNQLIADELYDIETDEEDISDVDESGGDQFEELIHNNAANLNRKMTRSSKKKRKVGTNGSSLLDELLDNSSSERAKCGENVPNGLELNPNNASNSKLRPIVSSSEALYDVSEGITNTYIDSKEIIDVDLERFVSSSAIESDMRHNIYCDMNDNTGKYLNIVDITSKIENSDEENLSPKVSHLAVHKSGSDEMVTRKDLNCFSSEVPKTRQRINQKLEIRLVKYSGPDTISVRNSTSINLRQLRQLDENEVVCIDLNIARNSFRKEIPEKSNVPVSNLNRKKSTDQLSSLEALCDVSHGNMSSKDSNGVSSDNSVCEVTCRQIEVRLVKYDGSVDHSQFDRNKSKLSRNLDGYAENLNLSNKISKKSDVDVEFGETNKNNTINEHITFQNENTSAENKEASAKAKRQFRCHSCKEVLASIKEISQHVRSHIINKLSCSPPPKIENEMFSCDICKVSHHTKREISDHMTQHFPKLENQCKLHYRTSKEGDGYSLRNSKRSKHFEHSSLRRLQKYNCEHCKLNFFTRNQIESHIRYHLLPRSRNNFCNTCNKAFKNEKQFKSHLCDQKILRYSCSACKSQFSAFSQYLNHQLMHSGEDLFECGKCNNVYRTQDSLNQHLNLHDFNYSCLLCGKTFMDVRDLKIHEENHRKTLKTKGELRKFKCTKCNRGFLNQNHLKDHMGVHKNLKPYKCRICHKLFRQSSNLRVHEKIHSKIKFKCKICKKEFSYKRDMERHAVIHTNIRPFKCDQCDKAYPRLTSLKRHKVSNH